MDTTERMMIMGMCLQGLLANPNFMSAASEEHVNRDIKFNIKLAHRYADALDPPAERTAAVDITGLTRTAYTVLVGADADGAGKWQPYELARVSSDSSVQDNVDGVFERVSRWYADPTGYPETMQDRIIAAVVAASRT